MGNNKNKENLDTARTRANDEYTKYTGEAYNRSRSATDQGDALRNKINSSYDNGEVGNTYMPAGLKPNEKGWFDLPGYGPNADEDAARGGYSDFAGGGGDVGFDANAFRLNTSAVMPSFYDAYKRSAQRRANVQGGYSPGFDAQQAEIGRQAGREGFNASRQTEADIADKSIQVGAINAQNRLAGIGGLNRLGESKSMRDAQQQAAQLDLSRMYQQGGEFTADQRQRLYEGDRADYQNSMGNQFRGIEGRTGNELRNLELRQNQKGIDWAKWAKVAGTGAAIAASASDRNIKENIEPVETNIVDKFKALPIFTWNYIGDDIKHLGPMAQDMKEIFGVGDGKTIHPVDAIGCLMLLGKKLAEAHGA